ncbi:hypothetical protein [uncultured Duncaniella sp.]|uniref:hypothetical protein n=1 Tax=uncultured Duncaniella sp. TaxID=2768039 RepID=UPI0026367315|nr:hypothetical protein [uncultured Duncaniella sp.]
MPEMKNLGHIDRALTNMSVAYMQAADAFIADKVFPIINVQKRSDVYFTYSKADMFRNEVVERGRGAESAGGNWNIGQGDPYLCRKYAFHYDITQEERVNYDKPIDVERDTLEWLSQKMLLKREVDFTNSFFKAGVWGTDITADGTTIKKFSDQASDPVKFVNDQMLAMAENTGKKPNFIIMAPDVFYALKNHDAIMDRIKYTQKGIITLDLIASLFEVEKIFVPWGIYNAGPQTPGYDDTKDDMKFLYKGCMLIGYRTPRASLKTATAGYIFAWTGLEGASSYGSRLVRIKMDQLGLGTERFEMEMAYDMKAICKDLGVFVKDLV